MSGPGRRRAGRLRHAGRMLSDLASYSVVNRTWWLLPLVGLLALVTLVAAVGQTVAPYTLYPLF